MAGKKPKAQKVIVYGAKWCRFCKDAKDFLTKNKIKFEDRDIDARKEWAAEAVAKSGQTGIPVLDIGGKIVVGFDKPAIRKMLGI